VPALTHIEFIEEMELCKWYDPRPKRREMRAKRSLEEAHSSVVCFKIKPLFCQKNRAYCAATVCLCLPGECCVFAGLCAFAYLESAVCLQACVPVPTVKVLCVERLLYFSNKGTILSKNRAYCAESGWCML